VKKDTTREAAGAAEGQANTISLLVARGVRVATPGLKKGETALWPDVSVSTPATSGIGNLIA
jgi:hypothetical protein